MKVLPFVVRILSISIMIFSLLMLGTAFVFNDMDASAKEIFRSFLWVIPVFIAFLFNEFLIRKKITESLKVLRMYAVVLGLGVLFIIGFIIYLFIRIYLYTSAGFSH